MRDQHLQESSAPCEHPDVRYFKDRKGAIACMVCGRLFGRLSDDQTFTAYNPEVVRRGS